MRRGLQRAASGRGDPSAPGPSIARNLHARGLVAGHAPLHEPGHAVTQLWIQGPDGDGPLQTIRQIDLNATDGRWTWAETGDALPFEEIEKYKLPRKRDRFTRSMLFRYLIALGIRLDALAKADAILLQLIDVADWPIQEEGWEVGSALLR
ncbi:hypothetical protein SH584_04765 [Sphingomonas sp. LY29]|uniref:hypothetical protein n=1 Tax=Sphingomonas sp. LY29 TaxID=3095341 RepID=UPI002D792892|nr:hypothetical protein [Sphingomonas sp. LY29]WRP26742.1 hypothetical protein SH584_04765 [Sphingomonas sp. LY29]